MQARGFMNYRLKYCWPKVIYFIFQPHELKQEIKAKNEGSTKNLGGHGPPWPFRVATAMIKYKFCTTTTRQLHVESSKQ